MNANRIVRTITFTKSAIHTKFWVNFQFIHIQHLLVSIQWSSCSCIGCNNTEKAFLLGRLVQSIHLFNVFPLFPFDDICNVMNCNSSFGACANTCRTVFSLCTMVAFVGISILNADCTKRTCHCTEPTSNTFGYIHS